MADAVTMKDFAESEMMPLRLHAKTEIAQDIFLFELAPREPGDLPAFTAGSHILVRAPNRLSRRYSLCNDPADRSRYLIAVKREAAGRGGSVSMAEDTAVGDELLVSPPLNYFALDPDAASHVLIAGGIGITPMLAMMRELKAKGADFRLIYCSRSPETTAFLEDLSDPAFAGRILVHHDHGDRERSLAIGPLMAVRPEGAHVYCCGPRPLMQAVRDVTRHWPSTAVHFEDFGTSVSAAPGGDQPFSVRLAKSGRTVEVPAGVSILEALRRDDVVVPSSCESGTCGACRTTLLEGIGDHRDFVLDEDEQDDAIMICVSRAKCGTLTLDI
ncbi:MAG TPA: PDR/VanB family oxidoreductase [Aliidongia sp.]|nr:PDR/VanB family oxidoreductase [Aliidongia sp.]